MRHILARACVHAMDENNGQPEVSPFARYILYCGDGFLLFFLLNLFKEYDWEMGIGRLFLLLSVVFAAFGLGYLNRRLGAIDVFATRALRIISVVALAAAVVIVCAGACKTVERVVRTNSIELDQGQLNYRAAVWLREGINPYARDNLLDPDIFYRLIPRLSRANDVSEVELREEFEGYWYPMDLSKKEPLVRYLQSATFEKTAPGVRSFMAYRYGPLMILTYLPFVCLFGKAGIYICHIFLLLCLVLLFPRIVGKKRGSSGGFPYYFALFFFLISPHLSWNIFKLSANDLLAIFYPFLSVWLMKRGNYIASGLVLGIALGVKLLPAALFVPVLFLAPKRRAVCAAFAAGVLIWNIPPLLTCPKGFICNYYLFNFIRPTDSTSFVHFLPAAWKAMFKFAIAPLLFLATLYLFLLRRAISFWGYLIIVLALAFATGPIFHNNYLVWFVPVLYIYLARSMETGSVKGAIGV
jgi:hypothetical protein